MCQSKDEAQHLSGQVDSEGAAIAWTEENALAIEERRTWIEETGVPLADLQAQSLD